MYRVSMLARLSLLITVFLLAAAVPAWSKVYIDLEAPSVARLPIAVQEFKHLGPEPASPEEAAEAARISSELTGTLTGDLRFANLFNVIDSSAFLEDPETAGITAEETDFEQWRLVGAEALIKGGFKAEGGRLTFEVRLFDTIREKSIMARRYVGNAEKPGRLAHYFADQLYQELTGRKGIFTTKLVFISKRTGNKEVYLSDYDGKNAKRLTRNGSINLSPKWAPDGKKIVYTTYTPGWPVLYMLDLRTGRTSVISKRQGINIGGRVSPDGLKVALTMSTEKSPELFVLDLVTGEKKRYTNNYGIDVSPSWSPDGKNVVFVSDISGNPHLFVLDFATGKTRRLTFKGQYNSSPAWSPDGKMIAFSRADKGTFHIWVIKPDGSGSAQLTFEGNNKSPSWSPDGRYIVYNSTVNGKSSLYIMQADGGGIERVSTGIGGETTPAWSPYLQ